MSLHGYMSHMTPSLLVLDLEVLTIYGINSKDMKYISKSRGPTINSNSN